MSAWAHTASWLTNMSTFNADPRPIENDSKPTVNTAIYLRTRLEDIVSMNEHSSNINFTRSATYMYTTIHYATEERYTHLNLPLTRVFNLSCTKKFYQLQRNSSTYISSTHWYAILDSFVQVAKMFCSIQKFNTSKILQNVYTLFHNWYQRAETSQCDTQEEYHS